MDDAYDKLLSAVRTIVNGPGTPEEKRAAFFAYAKAHADQSFAEFIDWFADDANAFA